MPQPEPMTLGRIVEKGGDQQIGIGMACLLKAGHHVEGMALVGDRHGVEQAPGSGRQGLVGGGSLGGFDPSPQMGAELADAMHGAHGHPGRPHSSDAQG